MAQKDILRQAAQLWNNLSDQKKKRFEVLADKDKIRYEKEFKDLMTIGYFIMADGAKSSDQLNTKKMKKHEKLLK